MWLYPVPALVALAGWIFLFATTDLRVIGFGVGALLAGCVAFLIWSKKTERWPFALGRTALVALACVALPASSLSAQTCVGSASFSAGHVRLGAGLGTNDGAKSYGVNLAAGASSGVYAWGGLSRIEYSDVDGSGKAVGLGGGYAINLNRSRTVQFCPEAGYRRVSEPDIQYAGYTITTSAREVFYGGSFGGAVAIAPLLDVVPFAGAYYASTRVTQTLVIDSRSETQNYGEFDVGAGFVINKSLTLQPSVVIPFGVSGAEATFDIGFAYNFGKH